MEPRNTTIHQSSDHTLVRVGADLDVTTASALRESLLGHIHHGGFLIIVDLSGVSHCDTFGLAVLLVTDRRARLVGGGLRLAAPSAVAMGALHDSGLNRHFAIYRTTEAAASARPKVSSGRTNGRTTRAAV
jgi:anti-sigma B factor antagonist